MQRTQTTTTDPTAGVTSPLAPWRVAKAEATADFQFEVAFVDGTRGRVDMRAFLQSDQVSGTVFEPVRSAEFFGRLAVIDGVVTWPNGADLAPDAIYDAVVQRGVCVV